MAILLVDDSLDSRLLIQRLLQEEGHYDFLMAETAAEALKHLGADGSPPAGIVELILMDLELPGMNGIEACRRISDDPRLKDIPVIVVTASSENGSLAAAFQAGAVDYLLKPINSVELSARVRSMLRLKRELDERKRRESELLEVTYRLAAAKSELQRLSALDGLTGITNRGRFDELYASEWKRTARDAGSLSVIMIDIDHFKRYNDHYGHLAGDDCLKRVAWSLRDAVSRPGDSVARYGGEEFVALLPRTDAAGAKTVAEAMRRAVAALGLEHAASSAGRHVSISLGVATVEPGDATTTALLLAAADEALYEAKSGGRNRYCVRELRKSGTSRKERGAGSPLTGDPA
ncbi:MAG TPA: diguanylate cyclase [Planctomycetota bacterium]|nr:diguanylate cyclase [Planctomycetota bacterium]